MTYRKENERILIWSRYQHMTLCGENRVEPIDGDHRVFPPSGPDDGRRRSSGWSMTPAEYDEAMQREFGRCRILRGNV